MPYLLCVIVTSKVSRNESPIFYVYCHDDVFQYFISLFMEQHSVKVFSIFGLEM
uniref:Uncharacterized protein n=1 Tax=Arion vulgaris TaxID=1028688 RepID=A0A0B6Y9T4_9EUPU